MAKSADVFISSSREDKVLERTSKLSAAGVPPWMTEQDPDLDSIRDDPEFKALMERK